LRAARPADATLIASARRWLDRDSSNWTDQHKQSLVHIFAVSDPIRQLVEMRTELATTWERSNASGEQLVAHLQQWCAKAEQSGVAALEQLALRMRRYKPAAVPEAA
jgi:stearoyl-CoA desaturase (Delta-9 desaturase)